MGDGEQQTLALRHYALRLGLCPLEVLAVDARLAHVAPDVEQQHHRRHDGHQGKRYYLEHDAAAPRQVGVYSCLQRAVLLVAYVFEQLFYAPGQLHAHQLLRLPLLVELLLACPARLQLLALNLLEHSGHGVGYVDAVACRVGYGLAAAVAHLYGVGVLLAEGVGKARKEALFALHDVVDHLLVLLHFHGFRMYHNRVLPLLQLDNLLAEKLVRVVSGHLVYNHQRVFALQQEHAAQRVDLQALRTVADHGLQRVGQSHGLAERCVEIVELVGVAEAQ